MKKEKGKFNLGKFFKTLVVVGMFAFVPIVFVGCQIGGGGGGGAAAAEVVLRKNIQSVMF